MTMNTTNANARILELGLSLGKEAHQRILTKQPPAQTREDWAKAVYMGMFAASLKYYRSLAALLQGGFEESAAVIGRTIMELSFQARYLRRCPDRMEDYMHWSDFNRQRVLNRCQKHSDPAVRSMLQPEGGAHSARRKEIAATYEIHKGRYINRPDTWHGLSTEELARECDDPEALRDYAFVYWSNSNLGHANPTGIEHFVDVDLEERRIRLKVSSPSQG